MTDDERRALQHFLAELGVELPEGATTVDALGDDELIYTLEELIEHWRAEA